METNKKIPIDPFLFTSQLSLTAMFFYHRGIQLKGSVDFIYTHLLTVVDVALNYNAFINQKVWQELN